MTELKNEPTKQKKRTRPGHALASPEFFHLLHRIEQVEQKLDQKIEQLDQKLDQKLDGLSNWIMATLLAVVLGIFADRVF